MTSEEAIQQVCAIVSLAWNAIDPNAYRASDGFCRKCPWANKPEHYRNEGTGIEYVRRAVVEQLKRDGLSIPIAWDENGFEKNP